MINLPADQRARDRALSPGRSFHLEAPAGSGKTSVLLARFLGLLARVEAPEELLALTFTRKAAGELRTRVMQLLWERDEPGPGASPHERRLRELAQQVFARHGDGAQLKLTPERLPIMTFHSFCAQLLRLAPQEGGVPLDFQLLEEDEARWVKQEALEELRRRLNARPQGDPGRQALVRRLVRLNNDWGRLAGELQGLLARRDSLQEFLDLARVSREPEAYRRLLEERFQLVLLPALGGLAQGLQASELGAAWPQFREALRGSPLGAGLPAAIPGAAPRDLPAWQAVARALLTKDGAPRKSFAPNLGFPADFDKARWSPWLQAIPAQVVQGLKQCRDLTPTGASEEEAAALQDLVILLGETLGIYRELCSRRRALDFIGLEHAALQLLEVEDPSELLLRLDQRLTHLLVDEFQDTSQNQLDLLCRLLAGWLPGEGRTLMVVGDPKQSIYGWRQAKPRLFRESREGLPCPNATAIPLEPLRLTTNFRATRTLIAWANGVFGDTVMGAAGGEIHFHAADPGPGAAAGPAPHLALFTGTDALEAREHEAGWLGRQVAQAAATLKETETIGILLFTRTHLPVYLKALSDAGVAVKVREGMKLSGSRVAAHLHNLARALTRPADALAWAAVLRGPWAPQSLETLARVAQTPGALWLEKLRRVAARDDYPRELLNLAASLSAAQVRTGRQPLAEILANLLQETEGWSGMAAWEGPAGVANARAYLDLLQAAESGVPEATFLKADFNLKEAFQPPDPRAQDSPVEVLTVHGAKGLEFDRVFLPFLDWRPLGSEDQTPPFLLEEIPGSRLHGLALARPYLKEKQSSLYLLLRSLKNQRVLEEARRVFYVAVTRARQRLTLSGVVKANREPQGESPLAWLGQHYRQVVPPPGSGTVWPGPEMGVESVGEFSVEAGGGAAPEPLELPDPLEFQPEPAPYQLSHPSQLAVMEEAWQAGAEDPETSRLRGEIMHRALETLAQGGELPQAPSVAAALRQEGLAPEAAAALAPEILAELAACRQDPFLARLLAPGLPEAKSEWLLEDRAGPDTIRRGKMDRLVFDGDAWWLLDYKTSRPPDPADWEGFIAREKERYRPQLLAYREMAAKAKGIAPPEAIRLVLYFTACRRAMEL